MEKEYKIRAVDFDGTLCENKWPAIGPMNMKLIYYLIDCQKKGDKIILWTCRVGEELDWAVQACYWYGLKFDAVNENLPEVLEWMGGDSRKIYADEYIDDRSSRDFNLPFVPGERCNDINTVDLIEKLFGIPLLIYQKIMLNALDDKRKNDDVTTELCFECVHHTNCPNEETMIKIMNNAMLLAGKYKLVVNDFLINRVGTRIRCVDWSDGQEE